MTVPNWDEASMVSAVDEVAYATLNRMPTSSAEPEVEGHYQRYIRVRAGALSYTKRLSGPAFERYLNLPVMPYPRDEAPEQLPGPEDMNSLYLLSCVQDLQLAAETKQGIEEAAAAYPTPS